MRKDDNAIVASAVDRGFPIADVAQERNIACEDLGPDGGIGRILPEVVNDVERDVEGLPETGGELDENSLKEKWGEDEKDDEPREGLEKLYPGVVICGEIIRLEMPNFESGND